METQKKKSIFKKWWFWLIIAIVVVVVVSTSSNSNDGSSNEENSNKIETSAQTETKAKITYKKVELQQMLDDLSSNALKAEKTYQDAYVEVKGKIKSFDSDGAYVSIEPVKADEWNFESVMCYIKNENQENFLLEKSVGDTITVKGQVTSIGEVLGYSIDIDSVK